MRKETAGELGEKNFAYPREYKIRNGEKGVSARAQEETQGKKKKGIILHRGELKQRGFLIGKLERGTRRSFC